MLFVFEIEKQNKIKNKVSYTDERMEGKGQFNPSLNNGVYTLGSGLNEFILMFQVAGNDKARIYNDNKIKVARIRNGSKLWDEVNKIKRENIDFNNRIAECTYNDLVYIVNKNGVKMLLKVTQADSESHGRSEDKIIFEWKILT